MSAIAIFVKTPGLSPVKTRLAERVGTTQAVDLYRLCAAAVQAVAEAADIGPVYWALAETSPQAIAQWQGRTGLIEQGGGDLGKRMSRVMKTLVDRHGSGLLLGADAPQLECQQLRQAADWLEDPAPRNVIGPAQDGGFWTFGANHTVPIKRWTRVTYSQSDTLNQFMQSMASETEWLTLPKLTDLDTAAALAPLIAELQELQHPLPAQKTVLETLEQVITEQQTPNIATLKPET
jgi:uncharacterized protein